MDLKQGFRVTPNVVLQRPLGAGGMGTVWIAQHESLEAEVAVKFLAPELIEQDPSMLDRFKREASVAARLKSPHVVQIFDHGVMEDGAPYIVMEKLNGESLGERLDRETTMDAKAIGLIVSQLAQVLSEAHAQEVVHRDIKPDNIFLIESDYEVFIKVLDFGIAKQASQTGVAQLTGTHSVMGTPDYMSPEQLLSTKSTGPSADLWAMAVLVYRALFGRSPFVGDTLPALSIKICSGDYTPPSEVVGDWGELLDPWFARAFAVDIEERFASAKVSVDALRPVLAALAEIASQPAALGTTISSPGASALSLTSDTGGMTEKSMRGATLAGSAASLNENSASRPWLKFVGVAALAVGAWVVLDYAMTSITPPTSETAAGIGTMSATPSGSTDASAHAARDAKPNSTTAPVVAKPSGTPDPSADAVESVATAASAADAASRTNRKHSPKRTTPVRPATPKASAKPVASEKSAATTATPKTTSKPPPAVQPPPPSGKPAYCSTKDGAYVIDKNGNLAPRPECL
jgi:serine/threonine-protein kinase